MIMSASARARKWTDKLGLELHQRQQSIRQLGLELFPVLGLGPAKGYNPEVRIAGRQRKPGRAKELPSEIDRDIQFLEVGSESKRISQSFLYSVPVADVPECSGRIYRHRMLRNIVSTQESSAHLLQLTRVLHRTMNSWTAVLSSIEFLFATLRLRALRLYDGVRTRCLIFICLRALRIPEVLSLAS